MYKILIPKDTDTVEDLKVLLNDIEKEIQDLKIAIEDDKQRTKEIIKVTGEDLFKDSPNILIQYLNYYRRLKKESLRRIKELENGGQINE